MSASSNSTQYSVWRDADGVAAHLLVGIEGMRCGGCARAVERALTALPGVSQATVNAATHRASIGFDTRAVGVALLLDTIRKAGYTPTPTAGRKALQVRRSERRTAIKRLGLAGLGMMQVMMLVFGLYTAEPRGIDTEYAAYLKVVSLLITVPVLLYSAAPIFHGAWRSLGNRTLTMDVSVGLALLLAFVASAANTLRGTGDVYYDSITMFVFLLLAGRFVEMNSRHASLSVSEALARSLPESVTRVTNSATGSDRTRSTERIAVASIRIGDRLSIPKGAAVPVDAKLLTTAAWLDQALISGESVAQQRYAGDVLPGGSVNAGATIEVEALSEASRSALTNIVRLLERAQLERPPLARFADRIAARFVWVVLLLAVVVTIGWLAVEPARALPAVLAVLVVSCPCALSLATPVALAAATTRLAQDGVLVTHADAIERLAQVDTVVLDKTGTLTQGESATVRVLPGNQLEAERALVVAAALERDSTHPIAQAFKRHGDMEVLAANTIETSGMGLEAVVGGTRYRLGRADYVAELSGASIDAQQAREATLVLGTEQGVVAAFDVSDPLRSDARLALNELRAQKLDLHIASGDRESSVKQIAQQLGIAQARGRLTPADKIAAVQELQANGRRVLMLGDGINDGPVLAAASVSCAMGQGSALAQAASDLVLLDGSLRGLPRAVATARRARVILRQNLYWAFAYNIAAIPAAALGYVPPWLAAVGMSASSLAVVLNAQRLARVSARANTTTLTPTPPREVHST
jgi:Cu2+-exporting ATPase